MKLIDGMYVAGYIVRFLEPYEGKPLVYGLFRHIESAEEWASKMTDDVVVEPVYEVVSNRG